MNAPEKDTIYIDIDDEITAMIDKMQASKSKIVALVLPKRAAVLQSIVNMKLLKKAATHANKNLVLITSEANLLPLAGVAGVHVAKNLQSKPEIPPKPSMREMEEELSAEVPTSIKSEAEDVDKSKSVGELATKNSTTPPPEDTIEVDNSASTASGAPETKAAKKPKKDKKNKIPNFERFRKRLFIGGALLIALIVFWVFAAFKMPKATITVKTDASLQSATIDFIASPSAQTISVDKRVIPAKAAKSDKSESQKAPATGQKDVGAKATGTITVKNCEDTSSRSMSANTEFSADGKKFLSNSIVTVPAGSFSNGGTKCNSSSVAIPVTAASSGEGYNMAAMTYQSNSAALSGNFVISGSDMSGGTTKVVKVVTQSDINAAKGKLTNNDDTAKQQLSKDLEDGGYRALTETFTVKDPATTTTPELDQEATEVTVSVKGTYTMVGVKEDELKQIVEASLQEDIDPNKQQVQDPGLDSARYTVTKTEDNGDVKITMDAQVAIGPKLDQAQLKSEIAGKKRGDSENALKSIPGVKEVTVKYSPFWVSKTPKNQTKINFVIEKAE